MTAIKKVVKKKTVKKNPAMTSGSASKVHTRLKVRHRETREEQEENLAIRVHRTLSWLERAMMCKDLDGKLIFLWIAFNAAYAKGSNPKEHNEQHSEQKTYRRFFNKLCGLDKRKQIEELIWNEFANSIRALLDNQYISPDFWEHQWGNITESQWKSRFYGVKKRINIDMESRDTTNILSIVFSRIYVLRNQLVHGGATWDGKVNREQIRDCARFMEKFVIAMLEILIEEKEFEWDPAPYPVMNKEK